MNEIFMSVQIKPQYMPLPLPRKRLWKTSAFLSPYFLSKSVHNKLIIMNNSNNPNNAKVGRLLLSAVR